MYRISPVDHRRPQCWPKVLALAILSAMAAPSVFAQQAPTFTLNVLLKASAGKADAKEVADLLRTDRALQRELGEPLSVRPALPLPPLEASTALDSDPQSSDARLRRWLSLTYNATTKNSAVLRKQLADSALFETIAAEPDYQFSYAINDELYASTSTNPNRRQWALDALNLPAAFDWSRGRVLIGAVDGGVPGFFTSSGTPESGYPTHPDLEANVRRHLSYTLPGSGEDPTYRCDAPARLGFAWNSFLPYFGHGSHVAGILAAPVNNGSGGNTGVSGSCPSCSLIMMQTQPNGCVSVGAQFATSNGAAVLNFSLGGTAACGNPSNPPMLSCAVIDAATDRDVTLVAASGNQRYSAIHFPASSAKVIGVGAIDDQRRLWDEGLAYTAAHPGTVIPGTSLCPGSGQGSECGSNYGSGQDVVAPGAQVISTITSNYIPTGGDVPPCTSTTDPVSGRALYGVCTGTSMATPYVSGLAGLVRSLNPLLKWQDTEAVIKASSTRTPGYTQNQMGAGIPDAEAALKRTLGTVAGNVVFNRVTPLFSQLACRPGLDASANDDCTALPVQQRSDSWLFTSSPQTAVAAAKSELYYVPPPSGGSPANLAGSSIPVQYFPSSRLTPTLGKSVAPAYQFRNGVLASQFQPGASAYLFTGQRHPMLGAEAPAGGASYLVPLLRMSSRCGNFRKHVYVVDQGDTPGTPGTRGFFESRSSACSASETSSGYNADVVEGYIWRASLPNGSGETKPPPGTQALYRHYNAATDDWILVLESERGLEEAGGPLAGYSAPPAGTYGEALLGFVYPNVDTDGDGLVDGFELTVGTDPDFADSDCDQLSDRDEFPLDALPISDPVSGPNCAVRVLPLLLDDED